MNKNVTLVSTVFNEKKRLNQTISDLAAQTFQPSEIVITDAGSTDGTYEDLLAWKEQSAVPVKILQKKGCNVAEGRNLAILHASHDLIVSTDFGCRFNKGWLKSLVDPFDDPRIQVVGGAFTVEETEQQTLPAKAAYIMSNGYDIDIHAPRFIPSSRSIAYKKAVFDQIGGYCEWLTLAADDLIFGMEIRARGFKMTITDQPYVYWGRHRHAKGFIREAERYGLGDGEAIVDVRNFLSTSIELMLRYLLFLNSVLLLFWSRSAPVLFIGLFVFLPGLRSYYHYTKNWLRFKSSKYNFKVYLYGFYLVETTRISFIKGYIRGLIKATKYQREEARSLRKKLLDLKESNQTMPSL